MADQDRPGTGDAADTAAAIPEYGGAPDKGVVSSVGEGSPAAGDVVQATTSEHRKIEAAFGELLVAIEANDQQFLRARWGGVVREVLEELAAEQRVLLPAARQAGAGADLEQRLLALRARLEPYDALNAEAPGDEIRVTMREAIAYLRHVNSTLLPVLSGLPEPERQRLGEDLRQVKG
ncbi:MAG: hypothetical protein M3P91_08310 [Actinomycetota bacterium]|nr:hypothetical protein [Actinomycetota bacterium]